MRNVFEVEKSAVRREEKLHRPRQLKGVYRGQFYRIKIPGPPAPSPVRQLLNPSSPPVKGFVHAETSSSVAAAASAKKHHVQELATRKTSSSTLSVLRQASRTEREDLFREYWEKVKAWWKLNWPVLVLNFGSICSLVGFTRTDVLELRCLSVTGSLSSVVYFMSQPAAKRSMTPIIWSLCFATVNSIKIYQILVERNAKVDIPNDQIDVYHRFFEPHSVTPKQFQYIMEKAQTIHLRKGGVLIREGDPLRNVFLITKGHTRAHHMGRKLTAVSYAHAPNSGETATQNNAQGSGGPMAMGGASGAWVGEMAFFEQCWSKDDGESPSEKKGPTPKKGDVSGRPPSRLAYPTSARAMYTIVALEEDTTVLGWTHADMEALLNRSGDMRAALMRAMTAAIVAKVVGFTLSRKSKGGPEAWFGRLWSEATQELRDEPTEDDPPMVAIGKTVFAVPEGKQ